MLKLKDYKKNFHHHDVPDALGRLVELQNSLPGPFCQGFSLALDDRSKLMPFSEKREFLDALCPIGPANGSGALYVLWTREAVKEVGDCPVLVFGDAGAVHIVAENVLQFLRVLTLDAEPMIDGESLIFMKDDGGPPSPGAPAYATWLETHFHLKPVKGVAEVELLVRSTQSFLEKPLQSWLKHFKYE